jgi:hypothetical protein
LVFKPSANVRKADQTTLSDGGRDRINAELTRLKKRREHLLTGLVSDEDTVGDSGDAADEIQQAEDVGFVDSRSPSWRASYTAADRRTRQRDCCQTERRSRCGSPMEGSRQCA